jgi:2,4-dienoyl-CoA reductase (NADPH2)
VVKKKIMVIGAGPAGMEAAITARKRGHEVTVFEKGDRIGGNLFAYASNDLARPDDLLSVVSHYEVMAKKLGIEMRFNTEANAKFMRSILHQYDVCLVAAGARTDMAYYRHVEGADRLVDALDLAHGKVAPAKRIVMIGAGKIGLTLAESLTTKGHEVVLVEEDKRIAGDVMPSFKWRHSAWVEELEIRTLTSTQLVAVTEDGARVRNNKGEEIFLPADMVVASGPRKSNHDLFHEFQWMIDELHGAGDAVIARGLDAAIHEGYRMGVRI